MDPTVASRITNYHNIHVAAREGDLPLVKHFVEVVKSPINAKDFHSNTPGNSTR